MKIWPNDFLNWSGTNEDLVREANDILARLSSDSKPMTLRNLRHYQSQGVVSSGIKQGKQAYFNYNDLLSLVTAKSMANQNWGLAQVKDVLSSVSSNDLTLQYQSQDVSSPEMNAVDLVEQLLKTPIRKEETLGSPQMFLAQTQSVSGSLGGAAQTPAQKVMEKLLNAPDPYGALKNATRGTLQSAASKEQTVCSCESCSTNVNAFNIRMIVCSICGNKRCPHATDHRNACTGSNDPGQKGSSWENYPSPGVRDLKSSAQLLASSTSQFSAESHSSLKNNAPTLSEVQMRVPWIKVQADFLKAMAASPEERALAREDLIYILNNLEK